mgnify:FL=1
MRKRNIWGRLLSCMAASLLLVSTVSAQTTLSAGTIEQVIREMTLHEKALLVVGTGSDGLSITNLGSQARLIPGAAGTTADIPRLGISSAVLADGPAGLRINPTRLYDSHTYYCTHFPIGTSLSSSWNTSLVQEVGSAIGNEVLEYGADVLLAPGVCIHRNPLCGRNFEYYSEDPVLSGNIAAAYINGVQSQGVGTSIKHYCFNNQETARMGNDARVGQRAEREIYLKNFEIAIKKSHPWTVMSSYNKVNGEMTSESRDLLTTILRDEWGYKGMVMSDWYGGSDPVGRAGRTDRIANFLAGNDLIEPGDAGDTQIIEDAVKSGRLSEKVLDASVRRILELIVKTPRFKGYKFSGRPDLKGHALITRNAAAEGTVLLKNNGVLPLSSGVRKVAVYGVGSYDPIAGGTGSGDVHSRYTVSLIEGLRNDNYTADQSILNYYTRYIQSEKDRIGKLPHEWWQKLPLPVEYVPADSALQEAAARDDIAVITLERLSGEGSDRTVSDFNLAPEEEELVHKVTDAFHRAGKKAVVILNIGGVIESASWKEVPDAILLPWQCGDEMGNSVADILSGKLSPSGRLPMTWPLSYRDEPSASNFPSEGLQVSFAEKDLTKYRQVKNVGYTNYDEGIYVGYRYFDSFGKNVSYPFGYGLSYTTFSYSRPQLTDEGDRIGVTLEVKNTGDCAGKEVVELYVTAPKGSIDKPEQELKAFAKTNSLQPGEVQTVRMTVNKSDLASFHEKESAWIVDPGKYIFKAGASSRDIRSSAVIAVKGSKQKVHNVLRPKESLRILKRK